MLTTGQKIGWGVGLALLATALVEIFSSSKAKAASSPAPVPGPHPLPDPDPDDVDGDDPWTPSELPPGDGSGPFSNVPPPPSSGVCQLQGPQAFLVRSNYRKIPGGLDASIAYRTQQYGYVEGFGDPSLNQNTPAQNSVTTTFFGLPVTLNKKVIASLHCVEADIRKTCGMAYQPKSLSGLRTKNTYVGGEVSNHMYGIAIDIDPLLNPCCGCIGSWAKAPQCKKAVSSEFDRMAMPECWVNVFEKYGWYWLGHDELRDTMHFEFLGVP